MTARRVAGDVTHGRPAGQSSAPAGWVPPPRCCTTASGPGNTRPSCPLSDQRTTYGGVPLAPRTSMISPSRSGAASAVDEEVVPYCGKHGGSLYSARWTGMVTGAAGSSDRVGTRTSRTPSAYLAMTSSGFVPAGIGMVRRNEP